MYITKIQVVYLVKELMDALNRTSSSVSLLYRKINNNNNNNNNSNSNSNTNKNNNDNNIIKL